MSPARSRLVLGLALLATCYQLESSVAFLTAPTTMTKAAIAITSSPTSVKMVGGSGGGEFDLTGGDETNEVRVEPDTHDELMYALGVNLARQLGDIRPLVESGEELAQVAKGLLDTVVGRLNDDGQRLLLSKRGTSTGCQGIVGHGCWAIERRWTTIAIEQARTRIGSAYCGSSQCPPRKTGASGQRDASKHGRNRGRHQS